MALICSDNAADPFAAANVGPTPLRHGYAAAHPQTTPPPSIHAHDDVANKPSYRTNVDTEYEPTAFRGGKTRGQS